MQRDGLNIFCLCLQLSNYNQNILQMNADVMYKLEHLYNVQTSMVKAYQHVNN